MAAGRVDGGGGGGGGQTVVFLPRPRVDRRTQARESLLATLQDRTAPSQPPLTRLRLTGRAITELGLMTSRRAGVPAPLPELHPNCPELPANYSGAPDGRKWLPRRSGGRGATNDMGHMLYTEMLTPREIIRLETNPDGVSDERFARSGSSRTARVRGEGHVLGEGATRSRGCEGRLDYASVPVTLSQLHKIMTQSEHTRKTRSHHTVLQSRPSTEPHYDTEHTDPLPFHRDANKTNIRISIKRDNKGETPAVRLTMKVTLPNIGQAPTTPSTAVVAMKRRERLPKFGSRQRPVLQPPKHTGASVTYPNDCDDVGRSSLSELAPTILRQLEATQTRPVMRTREWLNKNPLELAKLDPPQTPTPIPSNPAERNDARIAPATPRRIIKMKLRPKMDKETRSSTAVVSSNHSTRAKVATQIRLLGMKATPQPIPHVTSASNQTPGRMPRSQLTTES